jgi:hypothetical protein
MDTITLIGICSLFVLGVTSGVLALWCEYNDGIIGHASLALMTVCTLVVVMDALDGSAYQFLPTTTAMFSAMACFMLRHAFRAWRFRK